MPRIGRVTETQSRTEVPRGWGERGKERILFNGYGVYVEDDEEVLGIDSGDGYPALRMYLMPPNCTVTNG